jgi:hypothetical protein
MRVHFYLLEGTAKRFLQHESILANMTATSGDGWIKRLHKALIALDSERKSGKNPCSQGVIDGSVTTPLPARYEKIPGSESRS